MSRRIISVHIVALIVFAWATPASANGWSLTLTPRGEAAKVVGRGMQIYALTRELKNHARTSQRGRDNGAAISQGGRGNTALIVQRGRGNSGTIAQTGTNNTHGLIQIGRNNSGHVVQNGNGQVGLTIQGSW